YKNNILTMIEKVGAEKVLLITPSFSNPLVQHDERPNSRILAYGNAIRELAKEHQTLLADLQIAFLDSPNYVDFLQKDGFHLNEKGYDLLAELIAHTLQS
ncbi:MAG: GDSL-type esterase/lipase family protein, partial [Carnobacterium sp.]